jgi:hypothetical protein
MKGYIYPKTFRHDPAAYWAWVALFLSQEGK